MEEIKVGEYVRTDRGNIGKIIEKRFAEHIPTGSVITKYLLDTGNWTTDLYIKKHRKNITDLIENEDFVVIEYKSPKYRERIARKFQVFKINNYINFENQHCSFFYKVGDKKLLMIYVRI